MPGAATQESVIAAGQHLVLYDGVCGMCNRLVRFVIERDHGHTFVFAARQSEVGRAWVARFGGDPDELSTFHVVTDYRGPAPALLDRSRAALFVAARLGWPWRIAAALRVVPAPLLDPVYGLVARHRYRVFGRHDQCQIPPPEIRDRFVDGTRGR